MSPLSRASASCVLSAPQPSKFQTAVNTGHWKQHQLGAVRGSVWHWVISQVWIPIFVGCDVCRFGKWHRNREHIWPSLQDGHHSAAHNRKSEYCPASKNSVWKSCVVSLFVQTLRTSECYNSFVTKLTIFYTDLFSRRSNIQKGVNYNTKVLLIVHIQCKLLESQSVLF